MENHGNEHGRSIGNIGVLDIRKATEETVASMGAVGNVGLILHSPETAHLVARMRAGNLGITVEVPPGFEMRTHNGNLVITHNYFEDETTPVFLLVNGRLEIARDVPPEQIASGLGGLVVNGQLIYPESLAGALKSKIRQVNGEELSYPEGDRLVRGSLKMDQTYLRSLGDSSTLVVTGTLNMPEVLPNDLLEQKLRKLHVKGSVRCYAENAETILARLSDRHWNPHMKVIPSGFALIQRRVVLDHASLRSLPGRKLYCTRRTQVDNELDPAILDESLEALICEGLLICPTALKEVISRKCNVLETKTAFYEGEPWIVDGVLELAASRFDYLEGKSSLFVFGVLTISPDVEPGVLADRLADVHNFGLINCAVEQMGAIQARLRTNDGVLEESTEAGDTDGLNVGYLAL